VTNVEDALSFPLLYATYYSSTVLVEIFFVFSVHKVYTITSFIPSQCFHCKRNTVKNREKVSRFICSIMIMENELKIRSNTFCIKNGFFANENIKYAPAQKWNIPLSYHSIIRSMFFFCFKFTFKAISRGWWSFLKLFATSTCLWVGKQFFYLWKSQGKVATKTLFNHTKFVFIYETLCFIYFIVKPIPVILSTGSRLKERWILPFHVAISFLYSLYFQWMITVNIKIKNGYFKFYTKSS